MERRYQQDQTTEGRLLYVCESVDDIKDHLRELNGRTRRVETTAAVHSWAIALAGAAGLGVFGWLLTHIP